MRWGNGDESDDNGSSEKHGEHFGGGLHLILVFSLVELMYQKITAGEINEGTSAESLYYWKHNIGVIIISNCHSNDHSYGCGQNEGDEHNNSSNGS